MERPNRRKIVRGVVDCEPTARRLGTRRSLASIGAKPLLLLVQEIAIGLLLDPNLGEDFAGNESILALEKRNADVGQRCVDVDT